LPSAKQIPQTPLAERIRPKSLEDFQGQSHLVAAGKPISQMISSDAIQPFILWGPPGTGKTTIAQIISEQTGAEFFKINAVASGVKEIRQIIEIGKQNIEYGKRTILFIDEIHRFNKSQQDALLSSVEKGEIILIGATTENPSFEVIPALRSRVRIFTLKELTKEDLNAIINFALEKDEFLSSMNIKEIDRDFLLFVSGGDARTMLNILEAAVLFEKEKEEILITKELIENVIQQKNYNYDKGGEEHYNQISAFIKSIRGSDPDAALYWLARMLEGGEDPLFIARRLIVLASEDIGNAAPNGLVLAEAAFGAIEKIGLPEGRIILAQCVTYLAAAPKSNASYLGIKAAEKDVKNLPHYKIPLHLRNAPTKLMKSLDYGKNYKYPHDFKNNFTEENYFPDELKGKQYYFPTQNGLEKNALERLKSLWRKLKKY